MTDLKVCFEGLGLKNVSTYIQSGNVLISATGSNNAKLTSRIEGALSNRNWNTTTKLLSRMEAEANEQS